MKLFPRNRNDITFEDDYIKIANISCQIYYLIIYNANGNLLKDYEPALDEDNTPCLYETVGRTFIYYTGDDISYK